MTIVPCRIAAILFVLSIICISSSPAQSVRWEHFAGPEGGTVRSITRISGGPMFATVDGEGLYRSNDDGRSWIQLPATISLPVAAMVHATPVGALLLAKPDSTLYRSTDMGGTWSLVLGGIDWRVPLVEDSSGGVLCVDADLHRIHRSTDDGVSWDELDMAIEEQITGLVVGADGRLVAAVEGNSFPAWRSIRVSRDLGVGWGQVLLGDEHTYTVQALAATPDGHLFAGTVGELYRSDDGGAQWVLVAVDSGTARYSGSYSTFVVDADGSIVVGSSLGVYRSSDGGNHWEQVGNIGRRQTPTMLALNSEGELLLGTHYAGIYRSDGTTWTLSSRGLPALGAGSVAVAPDRTIYSIAVNSRLYLSRDDGTSWSEPDPGRNFYPVVAIDSGGRLYSANVDYSAYGVIYSTDRGATWALGGGMQSEWVRALLVGRRGQIYAGVERCTDCFHFSETDGVFLSTDRGESWTTVGTGLQGTTPQSIVELADGTLFVGSRYSSWVKRLDPGDTVWRDATNGLPLPGVHSALNALIADSAGNLYAGMLGGLFRSGDRGESWERIGTSIADTSITALALSSTGRVFAATMFQGVYASDDAGATWSHLGDTPDMRGILSLAIDSLGRIIAGTETAGLYRGTFTTSVPGTNVRLDAGLAMYPNPSMSSATVEFELTSEEDVRLTLYSSIGRRVAVVAEGRLEAGAHRIGVDFSGYASGRYSLRLETGRGDEWIGVVVVR